MLFYGMGRIGSGMTIDIGLYLLRLKSPKSEDFPHVVIILPNLETGRGT